MLVFWFFGFSVFLFARLGNQKNPKTRVPIEDRITSGAILLDMLGLFFWLSRIMILRILADLEYATTLGPLSIDVCRCNPQYLKDMF